MQLFVLFFTFLIHAQEKFPGDFQWCVATAGHQVEGDNIHSDWWEWEKTEGRIRNGEKSGKASFHMQRLEEDVRLMKTLNVSTYRFSIEWSRIEPKEGQFDETAIAHYRRLFTLLKKNKIEAMVTLHHFVQPQWFTASGGWRRKDSPDIFLRYTQKIEKEFGNEATYWVTFNEPMVLLISAYGLGIWPPGENAWDLWDPLVNILLAHGKAYHFFHAQAKARNQNLKVGMAHHLRPVFAKPWYLSSLVEDANFLFNWSIPTALKTGDVQGLRQKNIIGLKFPWPARTQLDGIAGTQDFFGINYYTRELISLQLFPPALRRDPFPGLVGSELNWGIDPDGFYEVLETSHKRFPNIPFYITENGIADGKDQWRGAYIVDHLRELHKAMGQLPHKIEGYCHWSLMDNFEWQEGFEPRFGLIHVDYKNEGRRSLRPSARLIQNIFSTSQLPL